MTGPLAAARSAEPTEVIAWGAQNLAASCPAGETAATSQTCSSAVLMWGQVFTTGRNAEASGLARGHLVLAVAWGPPASLPTAQNYRQEPATEISAHASGSSQKE